MISAQKSIAAEPTMAEAVFNRGRASQEERTYPLPSKNEIDKAERMLAQQWCIGDLHKWHRFYMRRVDWERGHVDRDSIWFSYREAGRYGFEAGRKVGRLIDSGGIDDRQFRLASGTYNLRTAAIKFNYCGSNWPNAPRRKRAR